MRPFRCLAKSFFDLALAQHFLLGPLRERAANFDQLQFGFFPQTAKPNLVWPAALISTGGAISGAARHVKKLHIQMLTYIPIIEENTTKCKINCITLMNRNSICVYLT